MIRKLRSGTVHFNYQASQFKFYQRNILKTFIRSLFVDEGQPLTKLHYIFCTDEYLLGINKQFLQHDDYTDIITFNYAQDGHPVEGECYISIERVKENALTHNTSFQEELLRVIIHGALHLCGYDDKDGKADMMRSMENLYLGKFLNDNVSRGTEPK